jgi:hypothetical protein
MTGGYRLLECRQASGWIEHPDAIQGCESQTGRVGFARRMPRGNAHPECLAWLRVLYRLWSTSLPFRTSFRLKKWRELSWPGKRMGPRSSATLSRKSRTSSLLRKSRRCAEALFRDNVTGTLSVAPCRSKAGCVGV